MSRLQEALGWLPELLWATALWWLGCLAGAGVLGIAPATVALTALVRRRLRAGQQISWADFWRQYRTDWLEANRLLLPGLLLVGTSAFNFLGSSGMLRWLSLAGTALSVAVVSWVAPLATHYELSVRRCWRVALTLTLCRPMPTALHVSFAACAVVIGHLSLVLALTLLPAAWIAVVTAVCVQAFDDNEARLLGDEAAEAPLPRQPLRLD